MFKIGKLPKLSRHSYGPFAILKQIGEMNLLLYNKVHPNFTSNPLKKSILRGWNILAWESRTKMPNEHTKLHLMHEYG